MPEHPPHPLAAALLRLELAAAAAGRLLPADPSPEYLEQLAAAFGPTPPKGAKRAAWAAYWATWLQDCAERQNTPERPSPL